MSTCRCSFLPSLLVLAAILLGPNLPARAQSSANSQSFTNDNGLTIMDETIASPYPSTIAVSGMTGSVTRVLVTLQGLNHSYPDDMDILLVAPGGRATLLMSDAGGTFSLADAIITFDDTGPPIPNSTQILGGVYAPANWGTDADVFPSPAPAGPYMANLGTLGGINPNGTWSLYIVDDIPENDGNIADGWSLSISTAQTLPKLSIAKVTSTVRMSWPETSPGYTLESRPTLTDAPGWSTVTNAVVLTNGQYRATLGVTGATRYFRLRK